MNRIFFDVLLVLTLISFFGCAQTTEFSKSIWGSSTRALEKARVNALVRIYNQPLVKCYEEVIKAAEESKLKVFINNKPKATIVLMGIKGAVDTTQVGVFFSEVSDGQTKVYISSLSSNAKRLVANKVFAHLDIAFGFSADQSVTVINEQ